MNELSVKVLFGKLRLINIIELRDCVPVTLIYSFRHIQVQTSGFHLFFSIFLYLLSAE